MRVDGVLGCRKVKDDFNAPVFSANGMDYTRTGCDLWRCFICKTKIGCTYSSSIMYFGENNSNMLPDYFRDREHNITGSYFFSILTSLPYWEFIVLFIYLSISLFIWFIHSFMRLLVRYIYVRSFMCFFLYSFEAEFNCYNLSNFAPILCHKFLCRKIILQSSPLHVIAPASICRSHWPSMRHVTVVSLLTKLRPPVQ